MKSGEEVSTPDPRSEYTKRKQARLDVAERYQRLHIRLGNARLLTVFAFLVLGWLTFFRGAISPLWLLIPAGIFATLVGVHDRIFRARDRQRRAAAFYDQGLARLEDRWTGTGESGDRFLKKDHLYADDLDLFGDGGLFELLSIARTRSGEETLARWLLTPAPVEVLAQRHAAIDELRPLLSLREDLAVLGEEVRTGLRSEPLAAWSEKPPILDSPWARIFAVLLVAMTLLALGMSIYTGYAALFFTFLAAEAIFGLYFRTRVERVVRLVELPSHDLALLALVLARIERERFTSPLLAELRERLDTKGLKPSQAIARLHRLMDLLDSRENLFMRIIGPVLLWTTQLAFAIEHWRLVHGRAVRLWLETVGEIEALSSLASYGWEHPADPFPEFATTGPLFEGDGLGHPLIPEARSVKNDIMLGRGTRLIVVSGSNMSGKSTLLRTVGVNAVLAMAGAPVRARRLRLSAIAVGASIRVTDSLKGGTSRFYAEITRLKRLMESAAGEMPVLFLLDELLHGTNSHDRRLGAEGVVRGLVRLGAAGLVTTHDLALAHVADTLAPQGMNVHFQDHLENGKISFDYILRSGVVRKSNALELMRSVGLDV